MLQNVLQKIIKWIVGVPKLIKIQNLWPLIFNCHNQLIIITLKILNKQLTVVWPDHKCINHTGETYHS